MTTDDQFGATCLECGILRLHIVNLERDLAAARAEAARLKKELAAKIPGQVVQSIRDDRDRLRAEAARLREARRKVGI